MSALDPVARRGFLRVTGLAAAAVATDLLGAPLRRIWAEPIGAYEPDPEVPPEVAPLLQSLYGDRPIRRGHVSLDMPTLAEDSRVVPLIVESALPMTADAFIRRLTIIVDYNPSPLAADLELTPELGALAVTTRIKMRRSSWVRAIAETNAGELWAGYSRVKITLDGCA